MPLRSSIEAARYPTWSESLYFHLISNILAIIAKNFDYIRISLENRRITCRHFDIDGYNTVLPNQRCAALFKILKPMRVLLEIQFNLFADSA